MTTPSPDSIARLENKIDGLAAIVNERLKNLDEKVESGGLTTRETIQALSEVVQSMARTIETTYLRRDVYDLAHKQLEERVSRNEDRSTWLFRTSVSALVFPILVIVITAALISTGGM